MKLGEMISELEALLSVYGPDTKVQAIDFSDPTDYRPFMIGSVGYNGTMGAVCVICTNTRFGASKIPAIFRYEGTAYNRPCGRGLCLGVDMEDLSFMIPSGDIEVSIVVRRRSDEVGE